MKFLLTRLSLLAFFASAFITHCQDRDYSFYIKVDSGVSFSQAAHVTAPYPPWDPATQGYNAKLGRCAIAGLSVGCELYDVLDLEASVANRSLFKYRKLQTSTITDSSYMRNFDINATSILFSANLLGKGIPHFHHTTGCGTVYPIIGAGVGTSNLLITNFRTTGLPATGDSDPYPSFSAENQYMLRKNFTYTLLAGFEYNHDDYWAIGTGYRWFNAGNVKGPRYQRTSTGSAVDLECDAWNMRFKAHEWFVELKILI